MRTRLKHRELADILARSHLSQNHWAMRLGISKGYLSLLVNGRRPYPSGNTRKKLLKELKADFDQLFEVEFSRRPKLRARPKVSASSPFLLSPDAQGANTRGDGPLMSIWNDIRLGVRALARTPGVTIVATLVLAVGVGANGAVFNFANSLLLSRPNLPQPDRLLRVYSTSPSGSRFGSFSYPEYRELRERNRSFKGIAAHSLITFSLGTDADAEIRRGEIVSGNYFSVLGVKAILGRTLAESDDRIEAGHPVAVISEGLWRTRFGGDSNAIGSTVFVNTHAFELVGVMPRNFQGSYDVFASDLWAPLAMYEQVRPRGLSRERWGWGWLNLTGRLRPQISPEQARNEIEAVVSSIKDDFPKEARGLAVNLFQASSIPEEFRAGVMGFLTFFMVVVGLVLLVACANVASLLLARVTDRSREIAVRKSMGASRLHLTRQLLTESLLLALLGGLVALPVSLWTQEALLSLRPPIGEFARFSPSPQLDWTLVAFTFLVALGTGIAFGLMPAIHAAKTEVAAALKETGAAATRSRFRSRWQGGLVVAQVCVSLVLMIVAGLLLRNLIVAETLDPGFASESLILAEVNFRRHNYDEPRSRVFLRDLAKRLGSQPSVVGVTYASVVPLGGSADQLGVRIPGHEPPAGRSAIPINYNVVGPDYFKTMGISLRRGTAFGQEVRADSPPSLVINETMANRYWPQRSPVGERVRFGKGGPEAEVVGVVADIKYSSPAEQPRPFMYLSFFQKYVSQMTIHVRSAEDPSKLRDILRRELRAIDPNVAPTQLLTFSELRQIPLFLNRAVAVLSTTFGILTLCLTAVGIYGIVAYAVNRRTREIGIRVALGADRARILRLVVKGGMVYVGIGIVLGLLLASLSTSLMSSLIVFVSPLDPLAFLTTVLFSVVVGFAACLIPALRAVRVDPIAALRHE